MLVPSRSIKLAATLYIHGSSFTLSGIVVCPSWRRNASNKSRKQVELSAEESFNDILRDVLNVPPNQDPVSLQSSNSQISERNGWRKIDWAAVVHSNDDMAGSVHAPSPVETIMVRDRIVHIKRDDQLRLRGSQISGNKARKMFALNQLPATEFPQCIVSYGGPQSNAMLAIAAVVRHKMDTMANDRTPIRFVYYTRTLPRFLKRQPTGNLYRALALGMELIQVSSKKYHNLFGSDWGGSDDPPITLEPPVFGDSVWVPQGGACSMATIGLENLANEICDFWIGKGNREVGLTVVVPGGTGATALLLNRAIRLRRKQKTLDIQVAVIPCVGDAEYAERQMWNLNKIVNGPESSRNDLPIIIPPSPEPGNDYFTFGEPNRDILETYQEMESNCDLTLDLLYGAAAWTILLRHWSPASASSPSSVLQNRQLLYVHTDGLEGLGTQLLRYKYKGFLSSDEVQLPLKVAGMIDVDQLLEAKTRDS